MLSIVLYSLKVIKEILKFSFNGKKIAETVGGADQAFKGLTSANTSISNILEIVKGNFKGTKKLGSIIFGDGDENVFCRQHLFH